MLNFTPLFEWSRLNCVAICAVLVPANLLATVSTLGFCLQQRAVTRPTAVGGSLVALTLFGHIATWFVIGVITPVTFILASLGSTCLAINLWAILFPRSFGRSLQAMSGLIVTRLINPFYSDKRRRYP